LDNNWSNRELIKVLKSKIRESLKDYLADASHDDISLAGKVWGGKGTARTFRFVMKYRDEQEHILFAKLSPIFPKLNPGLAEYEALKILYPYFLSLSHNYGVPKPIAFYPELNVLLMESVGSMSVKKYLTFYNKKNISFDAINKVKEVICNCGQWLRLFHSVTERGVKEQYHHKHYFDGFKNEYEVLKKLKMLSGKNIIKIESLNKTLCTLDNNIDMPCAMWHCDFTPGHIFIQENGVKVIDIIGVYDVPIYEDIGKWLATSATFNTFPVSWSFDYQRMLAMDSVFMNSYCESNILVNDTFILLSNLYRLKQLVLNLHSQYYKIIGIVPKMIANAISYQKLKPLFESNINHALDSILNEYKRLVGNSV
jgi:hypothetical protein